MLSYLNIYHFVSSCKKSENFNKSIVRKLQKSQFLGKFGPILAQNWPKTYRKKILMLSYLNTYHFVSSCKKSENCNKSIVRKLQKTQFLGEFGPILAQNRPKKIFQQKSILSHFNIYYSLTSCKKSKKFDDKILRKLEKPYFWAILGQKYAIINKIFPEKSVSVTHELLWCCNFMQKIRKF